MSRLIRFCLMALIAVVCLSAFVSQTEAIPLEISTMETDRETATKRNTCPLGNPCGWAVYGTSKTKKTNYFLRNTCRCSKEHTCFLSNEDLSLTAYVYRCKIPNPEDV